MDSLNIFEKYIKELDINADNKRTWLRTWDSAEDLLNNNMSSNTLNIRSEFDWLALPS